MMIMKECMPGDRSSACAELLRRLERPLSFVGEKGLGFVFFEGDWVSARELLERGRTDAVQRDIVIVRSKARLSDIRERLVQSEMTKEEAYALFEEGITLKRIIYTLEKGPGPTEEDEHADTKRWLRFGRAIQ